MDLLEFKRWHWALLGLFGGGLLAASRLFYGQDIDRDGQETIAIKFENAVLATEKSPMHLDNYDNGDVYITGLKVYPPTADNSPEGISSRTGATAAQVAGTADGLPQIQWVLGTIVRKNLWRNPSRSSTKQFKYRASIPYAPADQADYVHNVFLRPGGKKPVAGYTPPKVKTYSSITEYFAELNKKFGAGSVQFRYAWWESPMVIKFGYPATGLLLVGGLWPSLLGLMLGVGLVRKKQPDDMLDLSRYSGKSKSVTAAPRLVTAAEQARLNELNAKLEADLKAGAGQAGTKAAAAKTRETTVAKLDGGPLQSANTMDSATAPNKSFGTSGGAFYPTEIHIDKKD